MLNIPRVGFFSTPAFFANWQTNTSNTMRVTMNQTLIVALGSMVDGTDTTTPPGTPGLDTAHAAARPACYSCHQILDPSRSILAATYSWNYHAADRPDVDVAAGLFAFRGVIAPVTSVADFGNTLATHPFFAPRLGAEALLLRQLVGLRRDRPGLQQIVSDFTSSNYSWNALVKELLSSPIVTNAAETATAARTARSSPSRGATTSAPRSTPASGSPTSAA